MSALEPDLEALATTWRWFAHAPHGVTEIRVIQPGGGVVGVGFFDQEAAFVEACARSNILGNVYAGIQPRPRRLLDAAPNALRPLRVGGGVKDIDVIVGTVIDLDPVRPKDTASTPAELDLALAAAERAVAWCVERGLEAPRRVMSGNGAQLWFAIAPLALTPENREVVRANLKTFEAELRTAIESADVRVDSIHDLARIIKVVGTVSRKGTPSAERPHRGSHALDPLVRLEDPALRERLLAPAARKAPRRLPLLEPAVASSASVARGADGTWNWAAPVPMCGPVQRLWDQGCEDRSVAIFDMVRFFAHKGLSLAEITELVLEYDRRGLGKLAGRDGAADIRRCHDKVVATRRDDGTIAPPCHSLQRLGYCSVNRDPAARCDLYSAIFDIPAALARIPQDTPGAALPYRLRPILEAIAARAEAEQRVLLLQTSTRFGVTLDTLHTWTPRMPSSTATAAAAAPAREDRAEALQGQIFEHRACYYTTGARGEMQVLSSFVLEPTQRITTDEGETLLVDATTDRGAVLRNIRLPLRAFHSRRDLMRHLPSADLQWTGSDNNLQALLRILARRPVPSRRGVSVLGRHEHEGRALWVHPGGVLGPEGPLEPAPLLYEPTRGALEARVQYEFADDDAVRRVAQTFFAHVLAVNTPEVVLPILGWFFATAVKPVVLRARGAFPLLFVWGTAGSGKSSLLTEVFWPLVGVAGRNGREPAFGATETEFAQLHLLAASNAIPVVLDEYKPGDMPGARLGQLHRFLRRIYRGEVDSRGRRDQTIQSYQLTTPVCLAGETRPSEQALLERALVVNPTRTAIEQRPDCREAFRILRATPLHLLAPRYVQFTLGRDVLADLQLAEAITARLLAERPGAEVPERPRLNLVVMVLGLLLFEGFAKICGYEQLPADLGVRAAVGAVLGEVLEADQRVEDAFDRFLTTLGVMAVQGELRHRVHYLVRDGALHLHLESAHDAWCQHLRRIDHKGEVLDLRALRRLAFENRARDGYVTGIGELVYFRASHDRRRAVTIDLTRTTIVSESDFPSTDVSGDYVSRSSRGGSAPN